MIRCHVGIFAQVRAFVPAVTLVLKCRAPDTAREAAVRSKLLSELSQGFAKAGIGVSEMERAAFS